jgi:mycoredoxin
LNPDLIKVYGTRWGWDCYRAKKILDKNAVPYLWIDIDKDPNSKKFVAEVNNGNFVVPTIVFPDGSMLSEPSNTELRDKIKNHMKA